MAVAGVVNIPGAQIRAALAARGVLALHYAASVEDACRFLRAGALGTDGAVFLDAADVHASARRSNKCGPVLFVFDAAIVTAQQAGVCKCYPSAWPGNDVRACWFADGDEIVRDFVVGRKEHMVVVHGAGRLPFGDHLARVIVDDSAIDGLPALRLAMAAGGSDRAIGLRACACCQKR